VDICTYFGGSIPLAAGAYAAGQKEVWALTGDFSFIAAGHLGLLEAWQRQLPLKVVIFANGRAQATGGQPVPEGVLAQVLAGYAPAVQWVERPEEIRPVLERVKWSQKLEIVVVKID
jgi:TPP-dependent indolepyruvate ferredoxin oxidoreductase alpha subunit